MICYIDDSATTKMQEKICGKKIRAKKQQQHINNLMDPDIFGIK